MKRISSHLLLTPRGLEAGKVVTLSDGGVVTEVSSPPHLDREAGVEFFAGVLVPGFWNAHCHLELSYLRGAIPQGRGFAGFARGMRAARVESGKLKVESELRNKIERDETPPLPSVFWDSKMWSEGVSAVSDVCNGPSTFELKRRSNIKYHNFCELFGLGAGPEHLRRIFELRDKALSMGLAATVTPHSTYSLNRAAFSGATDGAEVAVSPKKKGAATTARTLFNGSSGGMEARPTGSATQPGANLTSPLSIHFMESEQEAELFKKRGPLWDWYREQGLVPDFLDYGGPAERLVAQVPPERPVMLVHNCCVTQRDIDIVMGHFTAPVTWVVCPGSNRYISGVEPPVGLLRKNGLRIAVGTDSLASNETLSMVRELSLIKDVPLAELLGWAAADTIEPGHAPGLLLLTGLDMQTLALTPSTTARRII